MQHAIASHLAMMTKITQAENLRPDMVLLIISGEDAKLKQMLWVVENLQEELFRSQEYRLAAEKRQQQARLTITALQVNS